MYRLRLRVDGTVGIDCWFDPDARRRFPSVPTDCGGFRPSI